MRTRRHKTPTRRKPWRAPDHRRAGAAFAELVRTMATLRSPAGCPWDRKQTPASLRPFLLEETYEALDAIDRGDADDLCGELGDVLFQCVFQAQVAVEHGRFDIADAVRGVTAKLIRRHPHVFESSGRPLSAAARARRGTSTTGAVLQRWEAIKAEEKTAVGEQPRLLAGIPRALPALLRAHEIGDRAGAVGFDWPKADDVLRKIDEEVAELRAAVQEPPGRLAEEMGDLLFSIANLSRKLHVDAEAALRAASDKFTRRFEAVEDLLAARGVSIHDASSEAMDEAWALVKARPATPASASGRPSSSRRAPRARRSRRS